MAYFTLEYLARFIVNPKKVCCYWKFPFHSAFVLGGVGGQSTEMLAVAYPREVHVWLGYR